MGLQKQNHPFAPFFEPEFRGATYTRINTVSEILVFNVMLNLFSRSSTPESVYYNRTFSPAVANSLTDPVLGGTNTSVTHTLKVTVLFATQCYY